MFVSRELIFDEHLNYRQNMNAQLNGLEHKGHTGISHRNFSNFPHLSTRVTENLSSATIQK